MKADVNVFIVFAFENVKLTNLFARNLNLSEYHAGVGYCFVWKCETGLRYAASHSSPDKAGNRVLLYFLWVKSSELKKEIH